jgi:hypothetical protein
MYITYTCWSLHAFLCEPTTSPISIGLLGYYYCYYLFLLRLFEFFSFFFVCFCFFETDRVSLYSPGCAGTHSVDQASLELRNPPASASKMLGLKACATTALQISHFLTSKCNPSNCVASWRTHWESEHHPHLSDCLCNQSYYHLLPGRL